MTGSIGIYIHVPFCKSKCPYCNFYSVKNPSTPLVATSLHERYFAAVTACMERYAQRGLVADTLYFGGGTPSLVDPALLVGVTQTAKRLFSLDGEITIEANPSCVNPDQLDRLREGGVNRISMGMQSAVTLECKTLGRTHTPSQVKEAVTRLKRAGFSSFSLDLMLGVPHQTEESLRQTLGVIEELAPPHLSVYLLKVEPDTPFFQLRQEQGELFPDEDTQCDRYLWVVDQLASMGLDQYEISNFARPGYESQHNLKYWKREEYLGFGPSAHSFFREERFSYPDDIEQFITRKNDCIVVEQAPLSPRKEALMLGLRLREGVNLAWFSREFSWDVTGWAERLSPYQRAELLTLEGDHLRLTPKGFLISNSIIATLLDWC